MRFAVLVSLWLSLACAAAAQEHAPWDYVGKTGPINWGKLDPSYRTCSVGREQSPIDIRGAHLDKSLPPIEFHYIAGPVTIENNGHTVMVTVDPGSYILVKGVRYNLEQFHFHHPSEEAIHGKFDDMDIHLVHRSDDGRIAVIAVRLTEDVGSPNATLATLWHHMPDKPGGKERVTDMVSAGGLLPADRGYWTYTGSLTTPPCTEGVVWLVLVQNIPISREQLRQFAQLYKLNSRPLQDAHGRKIAANE